MKPWIFNFFVRKLQHKDQNLARTHTLLLFPAQPVAVDGSRLVHMSDLLGCVCSFFILM